LKHLSKHELESKHLAVEWMRLETLPPQHYIANSNVVFITVEVLNTSYPGSEDFIATTRITTLIPRGPYQVLHLAIGICLLFVMRVHRF